MEGFHFPSYVNYKQILQNSVGSLAPLNKL